MVDRGLIANMSDRSNNGDYKYQRDEDENKSRSLDKEQDKEHQADKANELMRELLQEKIEINQKLPHATRLLDLGG